MGRQATRVFVNEKSREDEGAIRTRAEDYHPHNLHCPKRQFCINTRLPCQNDWATEAYCGTDFGHLGAKDSDHGGAANRRFMTP
jgi:hypothetical protein